MGFFCLPPPLLGEAHILLLLVYALVWVFFWFANAQVVFFFHLQSLNYRSLVRQPPVSKRALSYLLLVLGIYVYCVVPGWRFNMGLMW